MDTQGKGRRISSWKEKIIYKSWCLRLAYFNLVLPLYRNRPIDLLRKSMDWFLCNGNTGFNGKVDAFSLKVAKKLLNLIFKFSMILAWHFPLRAIFYQFYNVIYRDGIVSGTRVELNWIYFSSSTLLFSRKKKTYQVH